MKEIGQFENKISNNSRYFHNLFQLIHICHSKHVYENIFNQQLENIFPIKKPCLMFFFTLSSSLSLILSLSVSPSHPLPHSLFLLLTSNITQLKKQLSDLKLTINEDFGQFYKISPTTADIFIFFFNLLYTNCSPFFKMSHIILLKTYLVSEKYG